MDDTEETANEFDLVAGWTAEAIGRLPADTAIPGACRGSGNPASLRWLADALSVTAGTRFLDSGAGLAGPAAWLRQEYGTVPVAADPMRGAVRGGAVLFHLPSVVAASEALPFADGSFTATWSLGVLSTVPDKEAVLAETRRVLAPGGGLGLLEYVLTGGPLDDAPAGNDFVDAASLRRLLEGAGFAVVAEEDAGRLPDAPAPWTAAMDAVEEAVTGAHGSDPRLEESQRQERRFAAHLAGGRLAAQLVHARRV